MRFPLSEISYTMVGTRLVIYSSLPISTTSNSIHAIVDFDGKISTISHPTNATNVFNFVLYDTSTIPNTVHTLILSNVGHLADSPLQLDRLFLEGSNVVVSPGVAESTPTSTPVSTPPKTSESISNAVPPTVSTAGVSNSLTGVNVALASSSSVQSTQSVPGAVAMNDGSGSSQTIRGGATGESYKIL